MEKKKPDIYGYSSSNGISVGIYSRDVAVYEHGGQVMRHGHEWWELFWKWLLFKSDAIEQGTRVKNWLYTSHQLFSTKWGLEGPDAIREQIRVPPNARGKEK